MSQSAADDDGVELTADQDSSEDPEIEEDLLKEQLRIDGICGVY